MNKKKFQKEATEFWQQQHGLREGNKLLRTQLAAKDKDIERLKAEQVDLIVHKPAGAGEGVG